MNPLVSIVIPTLNGGATLRRVLDSVREQEVDFETEILAVDSGSTDDTLTALREHDAFTLSVPRESFNHGDTRNAILARARGALAVLLVQDAVPADRNWLRALVRPLIEDARVAGAFARQQPWPTASRLTAFYLARWIACKPAAHVSLPMTADEFAAMTPAERHLACAFDNVSSCIRMSVWREHPFRTTPIAEDLEWARDVLLAGHSLAYVPSAVVWHSHDRPVRYEFHRTYRVHQRLQRLFGMSTVPDLAALGRSVCTTLPQHLRIAATEPRDRTRATLRGAALAIALPLGQYLGARSAREDRELLRAERV